MKTCPWMEVLEGAGHAVVVGVVVHRVPLQQPVLGIGQGGPALRDEVQPPRRWKHQGRHGQGCHDDRDGCREEPAEQVEPVFRQGEGLVPVMASKELEGHQEGGNEEEDINPAGHAPEPDVVGHHHEDSQ